MSHGAELDVVQKLVSLCIRYANALERDSDYSEIKNDKLRKINELRYMASPDLNHFRATLAKPAYQTALSEHRTPELLRLIQYLLIALTFPLSVPLLMLHSWQVRGTVDFSKSNGEALVAQLIAISDAEIARQKAENKNTSGSKFAPPSKTTRRSNCTTLVQKTSASSGWVPVGVAGSKFFFAPGKLGLFSSDELVCCATGVAIVVASRLRPFDYQSKEPLVIDIYSKFRYSNQPPMTTTITIQTDFERVLEEVREKPSFYEPLDSFLGHSSFWQVYRKAGTTEGFDASKVFEEALALAETPYQKTLALEGIINKLHVQYKSAERHYCSVQYSSYTEIRERYKTDMLRLVERMNSFLNLLPAGYERITPDAAHLQEHFSHIFQLLSERKTGEAAYLHRRTPVITAFVSYAFPHLVAVARQIDAVFDLIVVHGFMMLSSTVEPKDAELRRQKIIIYPKKAGIWCALKTREGEIKRFCIDHTVLGKEAAKIYQSITSLPNLFTPEQKQLLFDAIAAKGYYKYNVVSPAAALKQLKAAYQLSSRYDALSARSLLEESIAPLQLLMRAGRHAAQQTPSVIEEVLRLQEIEECHIRILSGEFQPPENDQLEDAIWDELLYETAGRLKSLGVEISGDPAFSYKPC